MAIPSQIDRYVVERELGRGAFGTVFRARHAVTGRPVALKVLHARHANDAEMVERFFREARAAASTMSPYIVDVLDASIAKDGAPFLALELLDGEDLEHYAAGRERLATLDAIEIMREVAAGVADAHERGIVHRDLKPANVFLARLPDGTRRAKVLDFGMSKLADPLVGGSARTATGALMGTPLYMAPEQLQGGARDVDASADVYALGAILFRLLTGRPTHEARTFEELLVRRLTERAPDVGALVPALPSTLVHLVGRCLEPERARRTITAREIAQELGEMARVLRGSVMSSGLAMSSPPPPLPVIAQPSAGSASTRPWARILAIATLATLGGACVLGVLVVATMGGAAWAVTEAVAEIVEDVDDIREASEAAAPLVASSPASAPSPTETSPAQGSAPASPGPPPAQRAAEVEGVRVEVSLVGPGDPAPARAIATAAMVDLAACRGAGHESFRLEFVWLAGRSGLHATGLPRESPASRCAIDAIVRASRDRTGTGIVRFHVSLDPR